MKVSDRVHIMEFRKQK